MKGRLRSILIIIIAASIAITTGFYLVPKDIEKTRQTTVVVRLKEDLGKNQQLKEHHIDLIEVGSYNIPNYIVKDPSEVIGKYANIPMYKGEFAIDQYFQDEKVPDNAFLYEDTNYDGISFETDLAKCVGGIPQKGDRVRVIIYKSAKDKESESQVLIFEELSNLEIIQVATKNGISLEDAKYNNDSLNNSIVPGVVTVKADINQQKLLVKAVYDGIIHLALRPRVIGNENNCIGEAEKVSPSKNVKTTSKVENYEINDVNNSSGGFETSIEEKEEIEEGGFSIND